MPFSLLPDQGGPAGGPSYLNRQFFGVVSDVPFSSVQFEFTSSLLAGIVFLDRLYYGVPEPASGLMVLTVVTTGLATRARRPRGVV